MTVKTKHHERERQTWMSARIVPTEELAFLGGKPGRLFRVVAKEGGIDDWAAYANYEDEHSPADVANHGYKLPRDVAARLFPMLKAEHYRD